MLGLRKGADKIFVPTIGIGMKNCYGTRGQIDGDSNPPPVPQFSPLRLQIFEAL